MIARDAQIKLEQLSKSFKAIAITGPRQSGKTTLVRSLFHSKPYFSLENPDTREFAISDPRGFLKTIENGAVLDEVQRVPLLFSYLQENIDSSTEKGKFILTGSNNFLLQQSISQTLAGRVGYFNLLTFSINELVHENLAPETDEELIFKGFYPPIYDQQISPTDWFPNYIRTYIERDVRQIKNITDLLVFERFVKLLAGRTAQELNYSSLSVEVGVDIKTIQAWIGILESSFVIYLLKSHHNNFNKVIVKRPKIYFYDTSLACALLGITEWAQLINYPLRGALFETMVVGEMVKKRTNSGKQINLYYWRDKSGHEVDLIVDNAGALTPIEIKSGKTINNEFFKNLKYWKSISNYKNSVLLYGGDQHQQRSDNTTVMNWRDIIKYDI